MKETKSNGKKKAETKEQTLETILFGIRNILRSSGKTDDKRDAIIGLIFIKFASDKFEAQREKSKQSTEMYQRF